MGQAGTAGGVPTGYQPSEMPANQLAAPAKFVDDAPGWGHPPGPPGRNMNASASAFPPPTLSAAAAQGSQLGGTPPPPERSLRYADRLASFNTDVDAACDRAESGIRRSSFDSNMNVGFPYPPLDTHGGSPYPAAPLPPPPPDGFSTGGSGYEFGTRPSYQNQFPAGQSNAFNNHPALNSYSSTAPSQLGDQQPVGRDSWEVGCVVEVFSATVGRWYVARIMQVQAGNAGHEVLTVQFPTDDGPKMKSTYRSDPNLEVFGMNVRGELPPGFQRRPSQSRPGQIVYLDQTTGQKYASEELAWRIHLDRLFEQPVGCETVGALPSSGGISSAPLPSQPLQHPPSPSRASPKAMSLAELQSSGPRPMQAMSLAELQNSGPQPMSIAEARLAGLQNGGPKTSGVAAPGYLEPVMEDDLSGTDGKVALPSFGDARQSSQAAYLGYMGNPAVGVPAPITEDENAVYRTPAGARVPQSARPPVRACNPALQVWQDDPFSQWRQ